MNGKSPFVFVAFVAVAYTSIAGNTDTTIFVRFQSGSHVISDDFKERIESLTRSDYVGPNAEWIVSGHTDDRGSSESNFSLSQRRAESVISDLKSHGISEYGITKGYEGESSPLVPNTSEVNRALNRRVAVTLVNHRFETTDDLRKQLSRVEPVIHKVRAGENRLLTGLEGTKVFIDAHTFVTKSGFPAEGTIYVKVTEALELSDFLCHNLYTVSNGQLLESGGMMNIRATTETGEILSVNPGAPMFVELPTDDRKDGMTVFLSEDGSDWTDTREPIEDKLKAFYENAPKMVYPDVKFPVFMPDYSTQPQRPSAPKSVRKPKLRDTEKFTCNIEWWEFYKARRLKRDCAERLAAIEDANARKMELFRKNEEDYVRDSVQYVKDFEAFQTENEAWRKKQQADKNGFTQTDDYLKALAERDRLYQKANEEHKAELKAWEAKNAAKIDRLGKELAEAGMPASSFGQNYVFQSANVGWINCDRFQDRPLTQEYKIKTTGGEAELIVVYPEINAMMNFKNPVTSSGETEHAVKGPEGYSAVILAYRINEGVIQVAKHEAVDGKVLNARFKECSLSEFRQLIAEIEAA